ncbi:MAG: DHHA1 domain-containing protein, partial [Acidobacteria bacterium]|nr:DHHA1 domain-containing protein [Acidobacteriota bacterium]
QGLAVERRTDAAVFENRPISVSFHDSSDAPELRKASERDGTLRVITIEGLDRSACGGTHLRATGEIGPVLLRKLDRVRDTVRVEFLCGGRAVRRARADYEALTRVARLFSSPLDEAPVMVAAQLEAARDAERQRKKLESELAQYRGRELYAAAEPDASGVRRLTRRLPSGNLEELRGIAQSFTAQPKAVFMGVLHDPPSLLLAASEDAGIDAGKAMKAAVTAVGGRGGGTSRMAQGSVPSRELLDDVLARLT